MGARSQLSGSPGGEEVLGSEVSRRERSAGPTALGDASPVSAAAAAGVPASAGRAWPGASPAAE